MVEPTAHTIDKDIEAQNKKEQEEKNTYEDIKRDLANLNNKQQMENPQGNDVGREVSKELQNTSLQIMHQ